MINNKKIKVLDVYIIALFILFIARFFNISIFNKISKIGIFTLVILSGISVIKYRNEICKQSLNEFTIFWGMLILICLGGFQNSFGLGGFLLIIYYIAMLIVIKHLYVSKTTLKIIFKIMFIAWIGYFFVSKNGYNTNTVGQVAYILTIYSVVYMIYINKKYLTPIIVILGYFLIESSESRGCLLALAVFVIFTYITPKKIIANKFFLMIISICFTVGSIIFCYAYIEMWKKGIIFEVGDINKSLYSGRQYIWSELFQLIKSNPIFGVGSKYTLNSYGNFNSHNSMLNLMVVYGIPIYSFVNILIIKRILNMRKLINNKTTKVCLAGFLSFLMLAFFETNLLWEPVSFQGIFLLIIINSCKREKNIN